MKLVYIAHPIGGDVNHNINLVVGICREVFLSGEAIPFAPYLVSCMALEDDVPSERALGIIGNVEIFKRKAFDEIWFYGPKFSAGMRQEYDLANQLGIKIQWKDPRCFSDFVDNIKDEDLFS